MLAIILSVNYPHKAALNYYLAFWPSRRSSHFYIGKAHTQFRRQNRNQQSVLGIFTIRLGNKLEQSAMVKHGLTRCVHTRQHLET